MLFVTWLNQIYWISGATIGGLVGSLLPFNTEGIGFIMTSMFVVIFMDQLHQEKKPYTALIGLGGTALCLLFFGADYFMIPAMLTILLVITILRRPLEKVYREEVDAK